MKNIVQVGWWIVGDSGAKLGTKEIGNHFELMDASIRYWEARGYKAIPSYATLDDVEMWGVVK